MRDAVHSELLKVRSTQVWLWMLLLSVVFTGLLTAGSVADQTQGGNANPDYLTIFTAAQGAGIAMLVIGMLGFTTEFRHKTITPTLLAAPRRLHLVASKTLAFTALAVMYAGTCLVVNLAVAVPILAAKDVPVQLGGDVPVGMLKVFVLLAYAVLLGLAIGAVVRHQAAAMAGGILYFAILNGVWSIVPYIRRVWPFSPAAAAQGFMNPDGLEGYPSDVPHLSTAGNLLVMLAWIIGPLLLSAWLMRRRDIS